MVKRLPRMDHRRTPPAPPPASVRGPALGSDVAEALCAAWPATRHPEGAGSGRGTVGACHGMPRDMSFLLGLSRGTPAPSRRMAHANCGLATCLDTNGWRRWRDDGGPGVPSFAAPCGDVTDPEFPCSTSLTDGGASLPVSRLPRVTPRSKGRAAAGRMLPCHTC